jgi:limonene-1,2-epoxide hydrolase
MAAARIEGMAPARSLAAGTLLVVVLAATACGGGASTARTAPAPTVTAPPPAAAQPGPAPPPAPAATERVIRRWAATLRRGDVTGAARLFSLPAIVQIDPGQPEVRLTTFAELAGFNASLPCGATIIRTERRGAYAETLFRLVQREGAVCDGPGHTARAAFKVRDGRIVEWRRRLDNADDDRVTPPPSTTPAPSAPGGGGEAPT